MKIGDKVTFEVLGEHFEGTVASETVMLVTEGDARPCRAVFLGYNKGIQDKEDRLYISTILVHEATISLV